MDSVWQVRSRPGSERGFSHGGVFAGGPITGRRSIRSSRTVSGHSDHDAIICPPIRLSAYPPIRLGDGETQPDFTVNAAITVAATTPGWLADGGDGGGQLNHRPPPWAVGVWSWVVLLGYVWGSCVRRGAAEGCWRRHQAVERGRPNRPRDEGFDVIVYVRPEMLLGCPDHADRSTWLPRLRELQ